VEFLYLEADTPETPIYQQLRKIISSLLVVQKGLQHCLYINCCGVPDHCLLLHQLLQLWRLLIDSLLGLQHPKWKLNRLQKTKKVTLIPLNQQMDIAK
jgi:hypothetical protein